MSDTYVYTSKGYRVVEQDDLDPFEAPWAQIMEALREHPRDIETIAWGVEVLFGFEMDEDFIRQEISTMHQYGWVETVTDIPMYRLTPSGLVVQSELRQYETSFNEHN